MKLYQSAGSPNSRRVRIFLAEKNIPVAIVPVDLGKKEQFTDAYRAINPRSTVPTLVLDDGTAISEVPAIFRYLEEAYSATPLLGSGPAGKALVTMWERRAELEGFAAVMEAVRNSVPGLTGRALAGPYAYEQIPALAERSKARVAHFMEELDARLQHTPFVAGAELTAADITAFVTIDFAKGGIGMEIAPQFGALRRWYDTIAARPTSKA